MKESQHLKRFCSLLLAVVMVLSMMPISAFAAQADATLTASLAEAKSYIDGITINSSSNDPATVVKNFKTHFTWDNEKRENSKSYLFDWSYYNGVVFEGIEYVYEVTGESVYADYVIEYMSSLINANGGWATCSNNSSKQCAGYNATHGADCYKTASLLMDAYEMTGDSRFLTMANTLYADLDSAAKSYSLKNAGNNFRHTWASDPTPDLWLDGLYMILPFRAEYAKYIGDTEELDLIVSRMQWVSDNMYNSSKGLFYHAADSASSNSGTYWLRSIGWYAAAIVDIMDSMEGENLEAMKRQLVKLVDGMRACQNSSNGMWLNNMNASQSSSNPYETSGTALTCYAVMKAVNKGWLDESYADMAILAFNGICNEKLSGSNLTDICFKGAPGSSNSTFYDNEGKGLGPFIMFYAEVLKYVNTEEVPEETVPEETVPEETVPEETVPEETVPEETVPEETVPGEAVSVQGSGNLVGSTVYTLDSDGVNSGEKYLIVYSSKALQNNNGVDANPAVTISSNTITLSDDSQLAWTITQSGSNYTVENNGSYLNLTASGNDPIGSSATVSITRSGSTYKIRNTSSSGAYLRYSNSQLFCAGTSSSNNSMYLYRRTGAGAGSAVTFAVTADTNAIKPGQTLALNGAVTVSGSAVSLSSCTIAWSSSNTAAATVSGGTVTGVAGGNATITATLTAVNGKDLVNPIVLTIPVSVYSHTHSYQTVVTAPTCTQQGFTTYTCACGDTYVSDYTDALGHTYESVTVEPTCTTDGSVTYTCHCGDAYVEVIPATGHDYSAVVTAPTCTAQGFTTYTCACGDSYVSDYTNALGHTYESVTVEATCTADGSITYTCHCGDSYVEVIPATGHNYTSEVTAPTCTAQGFTTYTCACGHSEIGDYTDALGHNYRTLTVEPTCETSGYTTYNCRRCADSYTGDYNAPLGHSFVSVVTEATCETDGFTTHTCDRCGKETVDSHVAALGHDYTAVVTAPTCTEGGCTTHTCGRCGDSYISDETASLGHDHETVTVDATCTTDGSVTTTCTVCGDSHTEIIPATGHDYEAVVTKPTCTAGGFTTHTCGNCGDAYVSDYTDALGHTYESVTVEPTCTTDGSVTYTCHCGDSYVEVIPATGHDYTAVVTAPTCTQQGFTTYTCACGDAYVSNYTDALGHTYESVTVEPTCTTDGSVTYTCHCGDSYVEIIEALGHDYTAVVTAPTCTQQGFTTYTCACGDSYVSDYTDALGHSYESVTLAPTCETAGHTTHTCTVCGHSYVSDETAALGHDLVSVVTAPTCEADGYTTHTCTVCGLETVDSPVAALGHTYESVTVDATCTTDGSVTYTCHCGASYVEMIEALGHDYDSVVTAPTCTEGGFTTNTCSNCGDSFVSDETAALGHTYESVTVEAACTTDGSVTYTCHCGDSYAESIPALGHAYTSVVTEAACETAGFTTHTCATCGHSYTDGHTDALGHDYLALTVEPTCETAGYTTYTCRRCAHSYTGNYNAALGHDYAAVVTAPTCTTGGFTTHTCSNCGDAYITDETAALGHSYESVTVDATCTTDGSVTTTCTVCGDSSVEVIEALGHDYTSVVTAPTCTENGFTTNTCSNCGDSFISDETDALGHTYESVTVEATCTTDGSVTYTCHCGDSYVEVIEALGHDYTSVVTAPTCTEDGFTTHTCTNCGDTFVSDETDALGHTYESVTVDATCTTDGSVTYTCHCGDSYVEVIEALGHDYTAVVTEPTCTENGFTTYTCGNCGDSYVSERTDALGHSYESVTLEPTCETAGHTTHTCAVCGHSYTDGHVAALGHTYESVTVEPTCTTDGSVTTTCTVCGDSSVEVIEALGHDYTSVVTAPTCTESGFTTNTCANCGDSFVSDETDALGHTYESVTVEATCTEDGSVTYTCHCGDSHVEVIEALGHDYTSVVTAPTCTENGFTTNTCGNCGDSYISDETAALGHNYESVTVEATCTADGSVTYTCHCGDTYVEVIEALGHDYTAVVTAPTCTEGGFTTNTCATCGDTFVSDETAALGHSHEAVTVEATCTENGSVTYTCVCGDSYAEVIPATGHSYTCVETDGALVYTCANCGHSYSQIINWVALPGTYVLDTDGIDVGADHKYIVVGSNKNYALTRSGSSVGSAAVTIVNNTITLDNASAYEFYFVKNSKENGSYLLTQDGTKTIYHAVGEMYYGNDNKGYWHFGSSSNGSYQLYDTDWGTWYLNYGYVWGSNSTNRFAVSSTARSVRLFKAVDNYVRLAGSLNQTFTDADGATAATVLEKLSIQTGRDGSTATGSMAVTADMLSWNTPFDGTTAGTYTATVTYQGLSLGTVNVTVTAKHTYEIQVVSPTCTEGGCTVRACTTCGVRYESDHTDALGHSYSCTASDGYLVYTCDRCGDTYAESISWISLDNLYTLDTDGIDIGEGHKYIVVGGSKDYALTRSGDSVTATAVTVRNNTIVLDNASSMEFYFADNSSRESGSYLLTQDGSKSVYHVSGSIKYGHDSKGYWHIGSGSNGSYQLYDYDNIPWYLNYGYVWAGDATSRFAVSSTARSVRLFKAAEGYVRLASSRALTFSAGVSETDVLENLTVQTSADGAAVSGTVAVTADMVSWNTAFTGAAGTYTATVTYLGQNLGTVTVTVTG